MGTIPEQPQSPVSPPIPPVSPHINSSGHAQPSDDLPGCKSESHIMDRRLQLEEGQVSHAVEDPASGVAIPRKDTPIPFHDVHPVQQQSTASSPFVILNLHTSSASASQIVEQPSASETEEGGDSGSAGTELHRAYSTVLESANIPIGHQSSRNLRQVVLSRTTSHSDSLEHFLVEDRGNANSSQESFVQIFNFEPDSLVNSADDVLVMASAVSSNERLSTIRAIRARPQVLDATSLGPPIVHQERRAASEPPRLSSAQVSPDLDIAPGSPWIRNDQPIQMDYGLEGDGLASSYDSGNDPNKMKFWWNAGVRDGDPVATPPMMTEPSASTASLTRGVEGAEVISALESNQSSRGIEGSRRGGDIHNRSTGSRESRQSETEWAPSDMSVESIEQGRELPPSLSGKQTLKRTTSGMKFAVQVVDEDDHYSLMDVTNGGKTLLEPAQLLQQTQSQLSFREWDTDMLLNNSTSSRERLQFRTRKSLESLPSSNTSLDGSPGGILAPKKESEPEGISQVSPPGVDPSTLRISHDLQPWDSVVSGTNVTFKFLLLMVANQLRCYPHDLSSHPIVHYLAQASLVPENDLKRLLMQELSYGPVIGHHISWHDLFLWYRQILRASVASTLTSGTFQAIISSLIQVGLGLPLEPIENTLPKLQSNPQIVCLLPPGACRSHRELDLDDFETEERPQTPQGSRRTETRSDFIDVQVLDQAWDDVDQFAYNIKDDLELSSSSSGNTTPLPQIHLRRRSSSDPFLDGTGAQKGSTGGFELKLLEAFQDKREETSQLNSQVIVREKGKGKMTVEEEPPTPETVFNDGVHSTPASALYQTSTIEASTSHVSTSHFEKPELKFSNSKWNVFNRVLGLVSHTFQIPSHEILEDPRIIYQLVQEARTSVESFHQWWITAVGEEGEEDKQVKMGVKEPLWTAISDADGRWSGQSIVSAMFAILPAQRGAAYVAHLAPFQRALLHLVKICDSDLMHRPVEETMNYLRSFDQFVNYEPWNVGVAARQAIQNLKTHLESPYGNYLAPEARNELQEFVRVQEY